jgi:hypothetical protein
MVWLPPARVLVVMVAVPVEPRGTLPSVAPPSEKVTVPVGVPAPGEVTLTVAMKVTACPSNEVGLEEVRVVLVPAWFTTWVTTCWVLALLGLKLPSPP